MAYIDTVQKVSIQVRGESVECVAASFKGVPFFFETTEFSGGGRNVQTNSIPFSNSHVNEDTGGNVASFTFNVYFVGEDAESKKNEFLRVCNEEGAGELVHPYFGVFKARCKGGINLSYGNYQEYISGTVTFVPEGDYSKKNTVVSLPGKTRQKAAELRKIVADNVASSFNVDGKSKSVMEKAVDMSYKAVDAVYSARKYLQKASEFVKEIGRIKSNIETIMRSPKDYVKRVQQLVTMGSEITGIDFEEKEQVQNCIDLMYFAIGEDGVYDSQSVENRAALVMLMRMTGASVVAESLVDCVFSSVSEAERFQDDVHAAFEFVLSETEDPSLYVTAQELEAVALKNLRDNLSKIPYEVEIELVQTNNLLAIVYGVHGSLDRVEDVFDGNAIRDPLFVKPSDKLRVICDD